MRILISLILVVFVSTAVFAASLKDRNKYARAYATYYDRIQVGATASTSGKEGKTLNIRLKFDLDDFVVSVAKSYISEWENLGFTKVIVSDVNKSWTHKIK